MLEALRSFFSKSIRQAAEEGAMKAARTYLEHRLPDVINEVAREKFAANPDMHLTNAGFGFAMALELNALWPDLDTGTAAKWMWDYIRDGLDVDKREWTPATAKRLAQSYASEYGEQP
jgi:hypothetical protein